MPCHDPISHPKVRPIELHPSRIRSGAFDMADPTGIAAEGFTVSRATLGILMQMDGKTDKPAIQAEFLRRYHRMLFTDELEALIDQLDAAHFLEGPRFEARVRALTEAYRELPARPLRNPESLGAPPDRLGEYLDKLMDGRSGPKSAASPGRLIAFIAPHLDYDRGAPCYAAAYAGLADRTEATRFVILGTNHFGLSASVVGTRKDFETPTGLVRHDAEFMGRLNDRLATDLCAGELDHAREHSVELQVVMLKHVLGDRPLRIAPYLCPDPCGPSGTAPLDGDGVDLADFADAIREEIASDDTPTCIIAGADLSHVGRYFQDDRDLSTDNMRGVEALDRSALEHLLSGEPEAFRLSVASRSNDTNICSVGCMYVLSRAIEGRGKRRLLRYHQALTPEAENCVTCCAVEFVES